MFHFHFLLGSWGPFLPCLGNCFAACDQDSSDWWLPRLTLSPPCSQSPGHHLGLFVWLQVPPGDSCSAVECAVPRGRLLWVGGVPCPPPPSIALTSGPPDSWRVEGWWWWELASACGVPEPLNSVHIFSMCQVVGCAPFPAAPPLSDGSWEGGIPGYFISPFRSPSPALHLFSEMGAPSWNISS